MVVHHGHVVAEGWWAPYSADRPHLLYSLTKSFTSIAVGLAIADGLLSLDDRVVDVLPDHVPAGISEQGRRISVHHLLSMTAGHRTDSLAEAWQLEPGDLVKGFLRLPFAAAEGTRHTYDNSTTFILARMVERVAGRGLAGVPRRAALHADGHRPRRMGPGGKRCRLRIPRTAPHGPRPSPPSVSCCCAAASGAASSSVPREWVELATRRHIDSAALRGGGGRGRLPVRLRLPVLDVTPRFPR